MKFPVRTPAALVGTGVLALLAGLAACASDAEAPRPVAATEGAPSDAPFAAVARVLRHPRCLNCHPSGDAPRVGDDRRPHEMNVARGPDGHGVPAMRCASCHLPENQDLARVPGAPNWHLAPRSMGWEGLDDHGLAEALKDEARNGGRTMAEVLHHMEQDPLVLWGWDPGAGREAIPVPHAEFVAALRTWIDGGAVSPPPGTTSTFEEAR